MIHTFALISETILSPIINITNIFCYKAKLKSVHTSREGKVKI